jgi:hypothetical protein
MAKMICNDCGCVFDEEDAFVCEETLDVIDGRPYKETVCCCPECNGEYEAASECDECREYFHFDDLIGGLYCKECMADFLADNDLVRAFAADDPGGFAEFVYQKKEADKKNA